MIITSLNGRLGNQLFQYAFSICVSEKIKSNYLIDDGTTKDDVRKYFKRISLFDYKFLRYFLFLTLNKKRYKIIHQSVNKSNNLSLNTIDNNLYFKGSFQSTDFFLGNDLILKPKFQLKSKYVKEFQLKFKQLLQKKLLVIHYRIGDYKIFGNQELGGINLCLPDTYYENALKLIVNIVDYKIIVVTDDLEAAKSKLPNTINKSFISDSEINDFQLIMNAHTVIISNSTFAWWGAYLNINNAKVFAPEYWLGFKIKKEYPFNIIPDNFVKVSFNW